MLWYIQILDRSYQNKIKQFIHTKKLNKSYKKSKSKLIIFICMKVQYEHTQKSITCCFGNVIFETRDSTLSKNDKRKMQLEPCLKMKHQKFVKNNNIKTNICCLEYFSLKQKQLTIQQQKTPNALYQKTTINLLKKRLSQKSNPRTNAPFQTMCHQNKLKNKDKINNYMKNRFIPKTSRQQAVDHKILFENIDVKTILSQSFEEGQKQTIRLEQSVILLDFFNGTPEISHNQQKFRSLGASPYSSKDLKFRRS